MAEEVRSLAMRAKGAAKKTADLIAQAAKQAAEGATLCGDVNDNLGGIVESVGKVSDIVKGVSAASSEQALGVDGVSQSVANMSKTVQQSAAISEESASTSQELAGQARGLADMVSRFTLAGDGGPQTVGEEARATPTRGKDPAGSTPPTSGGAPRGTLAQKLIPLEETDLTDEQELAKF